VSQYNLSEQYHLVLRFEAGTDDEGRKWAEVIAAAARDATVPGVQVVDLLAVEFTLRGLVSCPSCGSLTCPGQESHPDQALEVVDLTAVGKDLTAAVTDYALTGDPTAGASPARWYPPPDGDR